MLAAVIPCAWVCRWYFLFIGGVLEGIFGDRFLNSWVSRSYREEKRLGTREVWWRCVWGAAFAVALWAAFFWFDRYYDNYM